MQQRNVTEAEVEATLEDPDQMLPGDNGGDMAIKQYGNREVRVVYQEAEAGVFIVFTVMRPRKRDWR